MNIFLQELKDRGLIKQTTNENKISELLDSGTSLYCGFDPTADSLHVGSLLPLITLLRFKRAGHNIIPLLGGATGMIGDPSFKSQERKLHDIDTISNFKEGIKAQIKHILGEVEIVDNLEWTSNLNILSFLRDFGKHFTVNNMINKDSVKSRIEREDQGISFTEFTYQILQAMDFHHLFKNKGCALQLGGSDQWGNIISGIDLIHKMEGNEVSVGAITLPLLMKSNGEKFGKSESGAIWLSAKKTSPLEFFQFWLNISDEEVKQFFKMLSFKSIEEIEQIFKDDEGRSKPLAQRILAEELTSLVHGQHELVKVNRVLKALFSGNISELTKDDFSEIERSGTKTLIVSDDDDLINIVVKSDLATSRTRAREFLLNGAIKVNGEKLLFNKEDNLNGVMFNDFSFEQFAIFQRGKQELRLIKKHG